MGSLVIPTSLQARRNLYLSLTERQKDILIGCVLGDAYIAHSGKIRIEQSVRQKAYVDWKYNELKSLAYPSLPREIIHKIKATGREYRSIFFDLRQYFRLWRSIFYKEKKKVFPENLLLTPLSIAVWYMDDGCWTGKKCIISIESFDEENGRNIQKAFHRQFSIETVIGKNRKLVIRKKSHNKFYGLISSYIIPSLKYKIPNPVTT